MSDLDSLLNRRPPTAWDRFRSSPVLFLAQQFYTWSQPSPTSASTLKPNPNPIRIVCIADTHNAHNAVPALPPGDVLVHAGDLTQAGTPAELAGSLAWLDAQSHPHKLLVAGNHDRALADPAARGALLAAHPCVVYLQDAAVLLSVRGRMLRVYGSPHTPRHGAWAFQYPRVPSSSPGGFRHHDLPSSNTLAAQDPVRLWSAIPPATDVLITHGPPFAHLDLAGHRPSGCVALLDALWRVRPLLHVFGHIHGARGVERLQWGDAQQAYEDVCRGRRVWWSLVKLLWYAVVGQTMKTLRMSFGEADGDGTVLVNAAAVGGARDDERRGAIVVDI